MVLGLNHPRGPLEWGDAIGAGRRARACSPRSARSTGEERYRPAPELLRGRKGLQTPLRPAD